uniref:Uncharacterized protein n=1 Tax=Oryza barthii TaxID=65489 RepID=A0A0D3HCQ6_9ORYZ
MEIVMLIVRSAASGSSARDILHLPFPVTLGNRTHIRARTSSKGLDNPQMQPQIQGVHHVNAANAAAESDYPHRCSH